MIELLRIGAVGDEQRLGTGSRDIEAARGRGLWLRFHHAEPKKIDLGWRAAH